MKQDGLKQEPYVSAMIPAYNAGAYIGETIQSLIRQTLSLAEVIVVDDCSSDQTCSIVNQLVSDSGGKVCLHRQLTNQGVSAARNLGVDKAKGDWILFMDADDIAEPDLVEAQYQRINQLQENWDEPVILAYSAYSQIDSAGDWIPGIHRSRQMLPEETLGYELVRNQIITTSGALVRKDAFLQTGGFDRSLKYSEDWDLWLRLAQRGGFAYVDAPLVRVRRHPANASGQIRNMLEGERAVLNRFNISLIEEAIQRRHLPGEVNKVDVISILYRLDKWEEGFQISREIINVYPEFADGHFMSGLFYLKHGNWEKAVSTFRRTLILSPDNGAAMNNLAAALGVQGAVAEATHLLEKVLSVYPNYLDARYNLNTLNATGHLARAEAKFTWRKLRPVLTEYVERT